VPNKGQKTSREADEEFRPGPVGGFSLASQIFYGRNERAPKKTKKIGTVLRRDG